MDKPRVLVIEDEPMVQEVIASTLADDCCLTMTSSGEDGLAALAAGEHDLVLLDVMLPGVDGYEVCRRLKADPATRELPVLFLSSLGRDTDEKHGLSLGAADFIHKPFSAAVLRARVSQQLQLAAATRQARQNEQDLERLVAARTEALERANAQLLQSEKMAAMGQLAAGVAHELNNPIAFVHSNLSTLADYLRDVFAIAAAYEAIEPLLAADCPELEALRALKRDKDFDYIKQDIFQLVEESRDGVGRARRIVQDLRDFSRAGSGDWQWADVHGGLDSTLNIVWNELKYKCTVSKHYGTLPQIYCVPSQLNQVFLNLLINAAQAIEVKGEITIATGCDGEDRVWIAISDTGKGIAPDQLGRIFEPFFTTKPVGKGTGLGLSLSAGIVERHQGRIEVDSEVGRGTSFRVVLPRQPDPAGEGQA